MSKMKSPNSPLHARKNTPHCAESVESAFRVDQEQDAIFSSELFDPGAESKASGLSSVKASNEGVADVLHAVEERLSEKKFGDRISQLDRRIDQFSEQLNKFDASFKLINDRLDSLDLRVDTVTTTSDAMLGEIESLADGPAATAAESDVSDIASKIETRFESLENIFKSQCEMVNGFLSNTGSAGDFNIKVNSMPVGVPEANAVLTTDPVAEVEQANEMPAEEDPNAHWQQQKQAMMAKFGGDEEMTESSAVVSPEFSTEQPELSTEESAADASVTVEPSASAEEATVDELKRELNSKIRKAEVEMSINRARLMQERVEFERAQAELERRAARLEAKLAASTEGNAGEKKVDNNLMSRFKRHLGS